MVNIPDTTVARVLDKVGTSFVSSCENYVCSELTFDNLCKNRIVQFAVPLVLVAVLLMVLKPAWSVDKDTGAYKYGKIAAVSASIYIVVFFTFAGVKAYLCKSCK